MPVESIKVDFHGVFHRRKRSVGNFDFERRTKEGKQASEEYRGPVCWASR